MVNFNTLNTFYKIKFIFIFLFILCTLIPSEISASKKRRIISGVEVKIYKKEREHLETSALLCALALDGYSLEDIKKNLEINFQKPISKSDKFLINNLMSSMCPEFDNKKIFKN